MWNTLLTGTGRHPNFGLFLPAIINISVRGVDFLPPDRKLLVYPFDPAFETCSLLFQAGSCPLRSANPIRTDALTQERVRV